jgi:hypothetical protein
MKTPVQAKSFGNHGRIRNREMLLEAEKMMREGAREGAGMGVRAVVRMESWRMNE